MIHDVLASLPEKDKRLLIYANEHSLSQHIVLPDGKFIGVNVQHMKSLNHEESVGAWSCGTVKGAGE